jgi:hypothetical protein
MDPGDGALVIPEQTRCASVGSVDEVYGKIHHSVMYFDNRAAREASGRKLGRASVPTGTILLPSHPRASLSTHGPTGSGP